MCGTQCQDLVTSHSYHLHFQLHSLLILAASVVLMLLVIITSSIFYDNTRPYDALESATFAALNRAVWSLAFLGFMFVVAFGSLTALRDFLSSDFWIPFSKLSYSAGLTHWLVQIRGVASTRSPNEFGVVNEVGDGLTRSKLDNWSCFVFRYCEVWVITWSASFWRSFFMCWSKNHSGTCRRCC